MNIEIVPIENTYRGIDRILSSVHFNAEIEYDKTLELYNEYLESDFSSITENCETLFKFYTHLKSTGVNCELITFDKIPLPGGFSFLGIDIANEQFESVLSDENFTKKMCPDLNSSGLFSNGSDAEKLLALNPFDDAGHKLMPYFVYSVTD